MAILSQSMRSNIRRPLLLPATLLILGLVLWGCDSLGAKESQLQSQQPQQSTQPQQPQQSQQSQQPTQLQPTITSSPPMAVGQPVLQPPSEVTTHVTTSAPFVIYGEGKLATGWSDASYGGA